MVTTSVYLGYCKVLLEGKNMDVDFLMEDVFLSFRVHIFVQSDGIVCFLSLRFVQLSVIMQFETLCCHQQLKIT